MTKVFDIEDVSARGMCIGCGACSVRTEGRIPMRFSDIGLWQALVEGADQRDLEMGSRVCPFSDDAKNEDELSYPAAPVLGLPRDARVGHYSRVAAGRRTDDDALVSSSSGGLTSWLLEQLLRSGHVDGVVHVGESASAERLFDFQVSYAATAVAAARKSQYYSTTFADALTQVRGDGMRYAIVAVPCYIKAARLLASEDPVLGEQLRFFVGLVCGHMKTSFFAESLAWQIGVPPTELDGVDFRVKNSERPASQYDFEAVPRHGGAPRSAPTQSLLGGRWGHAVFQPEACNFCDDIFAETADVVLGDAWLGEYAADWRGTNVVISRNDVVDGLLAQGQEAGDLLLAPLSVRRAAQSQAGNFRHRRDGLRVRLHDDQAAGLPVPTKRVSPGTDHVTPTRATLIRHRRLLSRESFEHFRVAKRTGQLDHYLDAMRALIASYEAIDTPSARRVLRTRLGRLVAPARACLARWRLRRGSG